MAPTQRMRIPEDAISVGIDIVPADVKLTDLADYDPEYTGNVLTTSTDIMVNEVKTGYSIVITDEEIMKLQPHVFINNLLKLFRENLPGRACVFELSYFHELNDSGNDDDDDDVFDMDVAEFILKLDVTFNKFMENTRRKLYFYTRNDSVIEVAEIYADMLNGDGDDEDDGDDDPYSISTVHYEEGDPTDPLDIINRALRGVAEDDGDDEDEDDKPRRKRRHSSYYNGYGASHVLRSAKNPKKAYHRHGVLISKNKNAIKKDAKILKEFLKDFIPGNAGWKKDLRNDLVKRWMHLYVVTSKQLKKLEREHRKMVRAQKKPSINTERTLELTKRLFTVPVDNWNNPNK